MGKTQGRSLHHHEQVSILQSDADFVEIMTSTNTSHILLLPFIAWGKINQSTQVRCSLDLMLFTWYIRQGTSDLSVLWRHLVREQ